MRKGKSRIERGARSARASWSGPIIAMTITLAAVYTPIGFQGGLTGSLFLEFAITLAAAVVRVGHRRGHALAGHELALRARARQGGPADARSSTAASRPCAGVYARLLDGALEMRWAIVAAALARHGRGLAALHVLAARARAGRGPEPHQPVPGGVARRDARRRSTASRWRSCDAITAFPETDFMWSLTAAWGGFGGHGREGLAGARALDRGDVRRGVRRGVAGARAARLPAPRPAAARRPASTTSSSCCRATAPVEQMLETAAAVVGAGWQSGKFLYVDTDLKIDLPRGARRDRPRAGRRPRARPRGRRPGARHAARRRLREPVQLLRPQLQGHPADRRRGPRDGRPAARPRRSRRRAASSCRSRPSRASRRSDRAAHAEPLPAAQRRARSSAASSRA